MIGVPGSEKSSDVQQLDAAAAVLDERREAAADADVQPHLRIGRVDSVHVVALFVGDHLERQLVVVAQEQRPLAVLGDLRRLVQDLGDGVAVLLPQRHEHPRHQREVERHVALVAVAEVRPHVGRPLVRLGEQHPVLVGRVELAPDALQHRVRLGQVLVVRALRARTGTARRRAAARRRRCRARTSSRRSPPRRPPGCCGSGRAGARRSGASSTASRPGRRSSSTSRCR